MTDEGGVRMTISEHLDELRKRLLVSLMAVVGAAAILFWRVEAVASFMRWPLDRAIAETSHGGEVELIQIDVFSGFLAGVKVAFFGGAVVAAPVVLMQMWAFISAGLYRHERRAVKFYAIPGFVLFLAGVALAYLVVMPYAFTFLIDFGHEEMRLDKSQLDVGNYISLMAFSMFMFGMVFQLPVVMVFLMRIGVVEPETFARYRRHAIVASFALAMVLTPPDVFTQLALASCMSLLYEAAILVGRSFAQPREEDGS